MLDASECMTWKAPESAGVPGRPGLESKLQPIGFSSPGKGSPEAWAEDDPGPWSCSATWGLPGE